MSDPIVIDVSTSFGNVVVVRTRTLSDVDFYEVVVDDVVRHPNCTAEDVIRALGNYLEGK